MDARRLLQRMCDRHGLGFEDAAPLLPLIERALISSGDVRDRILRLVENNLSRRAGGEQRSTIDQVHRDLDEEVLLSVSKVLHRWTPSPKVLDLGRVLPEIFPDGFDPRELD